jgi:hypothetical protein
VHVRAGEPLYLKAAPGQEDDRAVLADLTEQVMDAITALLPDDVRNATSPDAS